MNIFNYICAFFIRSLIIILASFYYIGAFASFEIIELMPNTLDDKNLEYIKIKNISEEFQNLQDYYIEDKSGKQYVFWEEEFNLKEEKKFFRTQTKLILNNSNEAVYLYNSWGLLINEVSYSSSTKWDAIIFWDLEDELPEEEEVVVEDFWSWDLLLTPDIVFWLQRPSYIFQSWSLDIYICDNSHDECKVNFDLRDSFSSKFPERDYECEIQFWSWFITGEEDKCNPNTVAFPEWEYDINFLIYHEGDRNISSEKTITVIHSNKLISVVWWNPQNSIHISHPKIIVQSGLEWKGRYFYCEKIECRINLEYKKKHEDEECLWRFHPWTYESKTTRTRCNPGYVTFPKEYLNCHSRYMKKIMKRIKKR